MYLLPNGQPTPLRDQDAEHMSKQGLDRAGDGLIQQFGGLGVGEQIGMRTVALLANQER